LQIREGREFSGLFLVFPQAAFLVFLTAAAGAWIIATGLPFGQAITPYAVIAVVPLADDNARMIPFLKEFLWQPPSTR
jgi:hypothetical protein